MTAFVVLVVAFCGWRLIVLNQERKSSTQRDGRTLAGIKAKSSPELRQQEKPEPTPTIAPVPSRPLPDGSGRHYPRSAGELNNFIAEAVKNADLRAEQKAREAEARAKIEKERAEQTAHEFENSRRENERKMAEVAVEVDAIIAKHLSVLSRKYEQLVFKDDYGDYQFEEWNREVDYFIERKLVGMPRWLIGDPRERIFEAVLSYKQDREDEGDIDASNDSSAYEDGVAARLRRLGWDARVTGTTGDQGADVIASKAHRVMVVQCKRYSQPVGNKAVQEVFAAKSHQRADFAIVVSNAAYTKSARQLAGTTGVLLLHHDELTNLDKTLGL